MLDRQSEAQLLETAETPKGGHSLDDITAKGSTGLHLEHFLHLLSRPGDDHSLLTDVGVQIQQGQQFRALPALLSQEDSLEKMKATLTTLITPTF